MSLSLTQTTLVRIVAGQAITNNLLRLLALSPSVSISGSVTTADIAAGAITPALTTPGAYFYGAMSGTNDYTLTLSPALGSRANGVEVLGKVSNTNTSAAPPALVVNSLGTTGNNIYHRNGQVPKAGDLVANDIIRFRYNSSRDSAAGGWDIMEVMPSATIRPAVNVTTGTANAQAVVNVPPLTAYVGGVLLLVTAGASLTNTAAMTLNCDGLGTRNVRRQDGSALLSQDWVAGQTHLIYDDGTQFILLGRRADVAVAASARGLVIYNSSVTDIVVAAEEVVLKTTDGQPILHSSVSLTAVVNAGVALNGLETGATRTTDTWYYLWLISDGTNVRAVLETAGTGDGALPGGPDLSGGAFAGYVYRGLVGRVRLNATGSGEIGAFRQHDRQVWTLEQVVLAAKTPAVADTWAVLAGTDLTAFRAAVPPDGRSASGFAGSDNSTDAAALMISGSTNAGGVDVTWHLGAQLINIPNTAAFASVTEPGPINSWGTAAPFSVPVNAGTSRNIQWKSRLTTLTVSLSISGYTI